MRWQPAEGVENERSTRGVVIFNGGVRLLTVGVAAGGSKMLWILQPVFDHRRGIVTPEVFLADGYGRYPEDIGSNRYTVPATVFEARLHALL